MSNKTTNTPETKSVKRGRPTVAGSKRQAVLAMREAKRAQGIEIKRGRPKMVKDETIEVTVKAPKAKQSKADKQAKLREVTKDVAVMSVEDMFGEVDTLVVPDAK
jgi:hypothetical protein